MVRYFARDCHGIAINVECEVGGDDREATSAITRPALTVKRDIRALHLSHPSHHDGDDDQRKLFAYSSDSPGFILYNAGSVYKMFSTKHVLEFAGPESRALL